MDAADTTAVASAVVTVVSASALWVAARFRFNRVPATPSARDIAEFQDEPVILDAEYRSLLLSLEPKLHRHFAKIAADPRHPDSVSARRMLAHLAIVVEEESVSWAAARTSELIKSIDSLSPRLRSDFMRCMSDLDSTPTARHKRAAAMLSGTALGRLATPEEMAQDLRKLERDLLSQLLPAADHLAMRASTDGNSSEPALLLEESPEELPELLPAERAEAAPAAANSIDHAMAMLFIRLGPPPEETELDYAPASNGGGGAQQ
ncbi:hypothetical protein [Streptomyces sp. NPDC056264]|uniref:hypothetical protein n=1 Tax=Streptomyces sp. NPDC056264 TaxID=3345767 RepID=UPI003AAA89B3